MNTRGDRIPFTTCSTCPLPNSPFHVQTALSSQVLDPACHSGDVEQYLKSGDHNIQKVQRLLAASAASVIPTPYFYVADFHETGASSRMKAVRRLNVLGMYCYQNIEAYRSLFQYTHIFQLNAVARASTAAQTPGSKHQSFPARTACLYQWGAVNTVIPDIQIA